MKNITPTDIHSINEKRQALQEEGFEFQCDQPNTPRGKAMIMCEEAALLSMGFRVRILRGVNIIDVWKRTAEKGD